MRQNSASVRSGVARRAAVAIVLLAAMGTLAACQRTSGGPGAAGGDAAQPSATTTASNASGGGGSGPSTPASATTTAAQPAPSGTRYAFRGLAVALQPGWIARGDAETVTVTTSTDHCAHSSAGTDCPGFFLLGPKAIAVACEGRAYDPAHPWHPSTGVQGCPADRDRRYEHDPAQLQVGGFAKVGTHTAIYRQWRVPCRDATTNTDVAGNIQRVWYLSKSRILIVDEWSVPGLAARLAAATWT